MSLEKIEAREAAELAAERTARAPALSVEVELEGLEKRLHEATKHGGYPWETFSEDGYPVLRGLGRIAKGYIATHAQFDLIRDAVNALPALFAELRALRAKAKLLDLFSDKLERRTKALRDAEAAQRRACELIANAYYEGFVECSKHQPWEDMFDWAALKGQDHARTALAKATAAEP